MAEHGTIGIDLGGTKTRVTLFDDRFKPIESIKFKTDAGGGEEQYDKRFMDTLRVLVKKAKREDILISAIGVGCAGHINPATMKLKTSLNIPFLANYPLNDKLRKMTGAKVFIGNDVQMGLYAEHQFGAAKGVQNSIAVFLGTGIGGALMINGKLFHGSRGFAGDIGHYLVQPLGPLGGSDRQGVLDDFASRTAIAAEAAAFAVKQWAPELLKLAGTDIRNIGSSVLSKAIKKGDHQIEELVRSRAQIVGIVLSNFVDFLNPEMIVLGGGLVEEMPNLIRKEVEKGIRSHSTDDAQKGLKIVVAELGEQVVAAGAAKRAWDHFIESETKEKSKSKKASKE